MFGWSAVLQWSRVGVNAASFLVFMRWIELSDIGDFALAQAPLLAAFGVLQASVPDAVIQTGDGFESERERRALLWLALGASIICCILMVGYAFVLIAFDRDDAASYALALSISPLIVGASLVAEGLLRKSLSTKSLALRTLASSSTALVIGLIALSQFAGAWPMVAFVLTSATVGSVLTLRAAPRSPAGKVTLSDLRMQAQFVAALSARYALSAAAWPIIQGAGAWNLGPATGGVLQISNRIYSLLDALAVAPFRYVILPIFNRARSDGKLDQDIVGNCLSTLLFLACPVFFGTAAIMPVFLPLLIGTNGHAAAFTAQMLSIYGPFIGAAGVVSQAMTAQGHAWGVLIRSTVLFCSVVLPTAILSIFSLPAMAGYYCLAGSTLSISLTYAMCRRYFGFRFGRFVRVIGPPLLCSAVMALAVSLYVRCNPLQLALISTLLTAVALGAAAYCLLVMLSGAAAAKAALSLISKRTLD